MCKVVDTGRTILAWIELLCAEWNLLFTIFTHVSSQTLAFISQDKIHTCGIVLTFVGQAVINVAFTADPCEAWGTVAAKPSFLQQLAGARVATWVAVAGIDHELAVVAMVPGGTAAVVLSLWQRLTHSLIRAREGEAGVAFSQNIIAHPTFALKDGGRSGQQQFVLHARRLSTASDAWLHVVSLNPLSQPAQTTVTVQGVGAQGQMGNGMKVRKGSIRHHRDVIAM